jgi:hypothetical protein
VYDFEAWKRHRSSGRYWRHMQGIFKSRTVRTACVPAMPGAPILLPCLPLPLPLRSPAPCSPRTNPASRLPLPLPRTPSPPLQVRWMGAPLAYVMSVATTVAVYHSLADIGVLPDVLPEIKSGAAAPFGLTSFALSSLLVLR